MMTALVRDVRFAVRLLRRNPGFTLVAVVTLALGVAATTAIFSVVYGLFFAPLPYYKPERLVMVWEYVQGARAGVAPSSYMSWKREATVFADLNAWGGRTVNLATADRPESVSAGIATPGFLAMQGYGHPLALGRTFHEEEGVAGRDRVVILTYRLWQDRFGGDPRIVGRQVRVDDVPHTVVGVLGEGPADHQQVKIWLPLVFTEAQLQSNDTWLLVMGRLKDDVSVQQANSSLAALAARLERERPRPRDGWTVRVEAFRNNFVTDSTKRGIWLLLGAVLFLLLIACANVANLLLARGTVRHRELSVRAAIGATPASIVRQLLVESLVLALAGGLLGALLALSLVDAIVALMPPFTLPSETEITLNVPVLLFTFLVCTLAGTAAALAPAWQATRANAADTLKEGSRATGDRRFGMRRALVALEFALALTLLAGGGMAVRALVEQMTVDPGFRARDLTTFTIPLPRSRMTAPQQAEAFYSALLPRIASLPGVASASVSTGMPVRGGNFRRQFEVAADRAPDPRSRPWTGVNIVSPSYHGTFGIEIRRGRTFADTDRDDSARVAIVNEAFASQFLAGRDPLAHRIVMSPFAFGAQEPPAPLEWEIVGVQADASNAGPGRPPHPEVAIPFAQNAWPRVIVAVRTHPGLQTPLAAIGETLRALDSTLPMAQIETIEQTLSRFTAADRFYTIFLAAFAAVALVMAAVGIYGVMSFVVAQRTQEIGLRMALGGARTRVVTEVLREGMTTALAGVALGAVGAALIGRTLERTVHGVEPTNPFTFGIVAVTLLLAALVACVVPARRAACVDPMVALRQM